MCSVTSIAFFGGLLLGLLNVVQSSVLIEGIYCGKENCYDVLGIQRNDFTKREISKIYRKLAMKYHPDRNRDKTEDEQKELSQRFQKIATAYETLKDDEQRKEYDYMLDNPEEAYYHYYAYYRRRLTPKVDVRIVLAVTLTVISVLQFFHKKHSYDEAVRYAMQNPKFRNQALQIIHQEGLFKEVNNNGKKTKNKKSKDERKREEERVLQEIVEDSTDIRGNYKKPSPYDTLWFHLLLSPYYLFLYSKWWVRWIWKFWILKEEYGSDEKEYLTYTGLDLSRHYWSVLDDYSKKSYLLKELWIPEKLHAYNEEVEDEHRQKLAESGRHKMWKRYMKKGGPGRMTFGED